MMYSEHKPEALGNTPDFYCTISVAQNGFLFSVNGVNYVIQTTGHDLGDFSELTDALTMAYKNQWLKRAR